MDRADELTVLRLIADALNNGDYESDPVQWKELAKSARSAEGLRVEHNGPRFGYYQWR